MNWFKTALIIICVLLPSKVLAERVSKVKIDGLNPGDTEKALALLEINPGDEFSKANLKRGLERIKEWDVVDIKSVDYKSTDNEIEIDINLHPFVIVSQIDVSGNFPYLERKVRRYLNLYPGNRYSDKKVAEQVERIREFYIKHGHTNPKVWVEETNHPEVNGVALDFRIKGGRVLRFGNVRITGSKFYPPGRVVTYLKTWRPYSESSIKKGIRAAEEFYHTHNFPQAKIKISNKKIDFEKGLVNIDIEVNEGPKLILKFEGYSRISKKNLRKVLTFADEGRIDRLAIEDSSDEIVKLYRSKGYPNAECKGKREKVPAGYLVTFRLDINEPKIITNVRFEGLKDVDEKKLRNAMANKFHTWGVSGAFYPKKMEEDNLALKQALANQGFLQAEPKDWVIKYNKKIHSIEITVPIELGEKTVVSEIQFDGSDANEIKKLRRKLKLKANKSYSPVLEQAGINTVFTYYGNNGYPYAKVNVKNETTNYDAKITYYVEKGPFVRVGKILFIGDVLTSQKALSKAMYLKPGDPFSYKKLMESQIAIQRLGAFTAARINVIGLKEKETTVFLKVMVVEQRPFVLEASAGYSTDDGFIGSFSFTNINAFGWAKRQGLKLSGGRKFSRGEVTWYDPRIFSTSYELGSSVWLQYKNRPAFTYNQIGAAIGLYRRYKRFTFMIREEIDRNYVITGDTTAADRESLRDNTISRVTLGASYDSRDSFADPRWGAFTNQSFEMFNEIKGNEANFVKLLWQGEWDMTYWKTTSSTEGRISRLQELQDNVSIPTPELLFMGGDDTVRGFALDSLGPKNILGQAIGGRFRWIINQEIRLRVTRHWQIIGFYDMGSLTIGLDDFGLDSIRNSYGFGIRLITPVGPIRADYGIKIDKKPGEDFGRFHLTFGYMF